MNAKRIRGAPEYLPLTDISRRLSKLCKDSSISNKQPLSEIRRIYTPIHASPPLRSCPLLLASGSPLFPTTKMPAGKSPWHFHTFYLYFFSGGAQELQPPHDPQSPEHKPFPDFFFLIKLCKIAETIAINASNTMIVPISFTSKPAQKSHIFIY